MVASRHNLPMPCANSLDVEILRAKAEVSVHLPTDTKFLGSGKETWRLMCEITETGPRKIPPISKIGETIMERAIFK